MTKHVLDAAFVDGVWFAKQSLGHSACDRTAKDRIDQHFMILVNRAAKERQGSHETFLQMKDEGAFAEEGWPMAMTKEHEVEAALMIWNKMREQGAEVVYGARGLGGRIGLALEPFAKIRGTNTVPENVELRSEDDVRSWLA